MVMFVARVYNINSLLERETVCPNFWLVVYFQKLWLHFSNKLEKYLKCQFLSSRRTKHTSCLICHAAWALMAPSWPQLIVCAKHPPYGAQLLPMHCGICRIINQPRSGWRATVGSICAPPPKHNKTIFETGRKHGALSSFYVAGEKTWTSRTGQVGRQLPKTATSINASRLYQQKDKTIDQIKLLPKCSTRWLLCIPLSLNVDMPRL